MFWRRIRVVVFFSFVPSSGKLRKKLPDWKIRPVGKKIMCPVRKDSSWEKCIVEKNNNKIMYQLEIMGPVRK
jgi:hypothetical protein